MISVRKWVFLENKHCSLNIEDIFTKFTGHPMNWINMMSSKGQVSVNKTLDFISKMEGPVYFEQVGTYIQIDNQSRFLCVFCLFV